MLGENIYKLRKKVGFSQEVLGEQLNVTRQTISNWELGETRTKSRTIKTVVKSF